MVVRTGKADSQESAVGRAAACALRARKAGHAGRNAALAAAIQGLRDGLKGEKALMAAPLALAALEQRRAVPHDPDRFCW